MRPAALTLLGRICWKNQTTAPAWTSQRSRLDRCFSSRPDLFELDLRRVGGLDPACARAHQASPGLISGNLRMCSWQGRQFNCASDYLPERQARLVGVRQPTSSAHKCSAPAKMRRRSYRRASAQPVYKTRGPSLAQLVAFGPA